MNTSRRRSALLLSLVLLAADPAPAQTPSNLATCLVEKADGTMAFLRSFHAGLTSCLRFSNYADCPVNNPEQELYDNMLRSGACQQALNDGATFDDLYPGIGKPSWGYSINVTTLERVVSAHWWSARGLYWKLLYDLDLPEATPSSSFERKCIRAAVTSVIKAIRTGAREQFDCAKAAGNPPWDCPIVADGDSRLARAFTAADRKLARCRSASGATGSISGAAADLCNSAIASPADLAACVRRSALCQICAISTSTLGTAHDCAAVSGDRDCDTSYGREFGKPEAGAFAVANEAEDSITLFAADGGYADGDLAASTRAVGAGPVEVAVAERANVWVSVNRDGNSVTLLHANDGSWGNGSLVSSTVAVGSAPSAAVVGPESDILHVANRGDGTVTLLDASDGSYLYGTLEASTFPSGAGPSALALHPDGSILYVANTTDGSVTFLDARTGLPLFGALASSTVLVGNAPSALAVYSTGTGARVAVANEEDDTVYLLDAATGLPADGSPAASTRIVPGGPIAISTIDEQGPTLLVATAETPAIAALRESDPWMTNDGPFATGDVPLAFAPGDATLAGANGYRFGAPARLLVTSPDQDLVFRVPLLTPYALVGPSASERSLIPLPPNPTYVAANESVPGWYVVYVRPNNADPLLFVDANGEIQWEVEVPWSTQAVQYSNATNTVFLGTYGGVLYLDGTDGTPRFGTEAASTFSCGCTTQAQPRAVDDATGTLYATCGNYVLFLDTTDGSCSPAQSPAITASSEVKDVVLDRTNGILYVGFSYSTGIEHRFAVVQHDATTGAWWTGNYETSVVYNAPYPYDYWSPASLRLGLSPDGSTLYALDNGNDVLAAIDASSFAVLASRPCAELGDGTPSWLFGGATAGDPLLVFQQGTSTAASRPASSYLYDTEPRFDDIVYLDPATLGFVTGDRATSRLILGESDRYSVVPPLAYNAATGSIAKTAYDGVEGGFGAVPVENVGPGLVLVDATAPAFSWNLSTEQAGEPLATGDRPRGIAAMPAHTQRLP